MSDLIYDRRRQLDKERREFQRQAMAEFDAKRAEQLKQLYADCEADGGHRWQFSFSGPLGDPWFVCSRCQNLKVLRDE